MGRIDCSGRTEVGAKTRDMVAAAHEWSYGRLRQQRSQQQVDDNQRVWRQLEVSSDVRTAAAGAAAAEKMMILLSTSRCGWRMSYTLLSWPWTPLISIRSPRSCCLPHSGKSKTVNSV